MEDVTPSLGIAVYSQHVVLPYDPIPVSAVIVIEGELITRILRVTSDEFEELMAVELRHYIVFDYSDLYISPGIVDINVCFNTPTRIIGGAFADLRKSSHDVEVVSNEGWEGYFYGTMTAAAGGVTTIVEKPSMLEQDMHTVEIIQAKRKYLSQIGLYCDIGLLAYISPQNVDKIQAFSAQGVLGFKGSVVQLGFGHPYFNFAEMSSALQQISETGKPLIIYTTMTTEPQICKLSPFRNTHLEDRVSHPTPEISSCFNAAYSEDVDNSSDSEDSDSDSTEITALEVSCFNGKTLMGNLDDNMLDRAVKRLNMNHVQVITAELQTYKGSGSTTYKASSADKIPTHSQIRGSGFRKLIRPNKIICINTNTSSRSCSYSGFLANYPLDWEKRGTEALLALAEKNPDCKLHLTRLSSAVSVHLAHSAKQSNPNLNVTFDISATTAFFSADSVPDGDTRFKEFPPIRDEENREILVKYLAKGIIQCVSSSHLLIKPNLKFLERGSFARAIKGISCNGLTLQATWMSLGANDDKLLPLLANVLSKGPADIVGLGHYKGSIEVGKNADLIVWDPHETFLVCSDSFPMKHPQLNVFQGRLMKGKIYAVFCRGKQSYASPTFTACGKLI